MNLIYYFYTVLLLLVNLAGLTLFMSRWLPTFALARAAGLLLFCTVVFFMEHFIGFGQLAWVWPITTAAAVIMLYSERHNRCSPIFWRSELVRCGCRGRLVWSARLDLTPMTVRRFKPGRN